MGETKRFIKKLEEHKEKTDSNLKYSIDRFDILIISIASGGLVFSMNFVKDLIPEGTVVKFGLIKISWILFGLAIIFNLLSQVTSYYANKFELKITRNIIRQERKKEMQGDQTKYENKERVLDFLTIQLNGYSLISLISGLVIFVIFLIKTL
jgi:hypothetical protein